MCNPCSLLLSRASCTSVDRLYLFILAVALARPPPPHNLPSSAALLYTRYYHCWWRYVMPLTWWYIHSPVDSIEFFSPTCIPTSLGGLRCALAALSCSSRLPVVAAQFLSGVHLAVVYLLISPLPMYVSSLPIIRRSTPLLSRTQ